MTNREIFIEYVKPIMETGDAPDEALAYFETIKNKKDKEVAEITPLGFEILGAMQTEDIGTEFTAKELGEIASKLTGREITGRKASGGTRKLIKSGHIEKVADSVPPKYILTELGNSVEITFEPAIVE